MSHDVAQICENGHVISSYHLSYPENSQKFCDKCGAPTITACQKCNTNIRGNILDDFPDLQYKAPKFCLYCGGAFPWTGSRLNAAKELAEELDSLDEQEKALLAKSVYDLVKDSPSTPLAIIRFQKIMAKVGTTAASMFREILVDVLSDAAKKALFP